MHVKQHSVHTCITIHFVRIFDFTLSRVNLRVFAFNVFLSQSTGTYILPLTQTLTLPLSCGPKPTYILAFVVKPNRVKTCLLPTGRLQCGPPETPPAAPPNQPGGGGGGKILVGSKFLAADVGKKLLLARATSTSLRIQ